LEEFSVVLGVNVIEIFIVLNISSKCGADFILEDIPGYVFALRASPAKVYKQIRRIGEVTLSLGQ